MKAHKLISKVLQQELLGPNASCKISKIPILVFLSLAITIRVPGIGYFEIEKFFFYVCFPLCFVSNTSILYVKFGVHVISTAHSVLVLCIFFYQKLSMVEPVRMSASSTSMATFRGTLPNYGLGWVIVGPPPWKLWRSAWKWHAPENLPTDLSLICSTKSKVLAHQMGARVI